MEENVKMKALLAHYWGRQSKAKAFRAEHLGAKERADWAAAGGAGEEWVMCRARHPRKTPGQEQGWDSSGETG